MIKKILFVDDDESILDAAKTALEVYGYEVETASSGFECLEKLEGIDLVFLDIKMPKMSGIETLKEIKKRKPSLPVIMITAYATVDTAIEAMKLGASDYIRKPFNMEELEKSILASIEDIKFRKIEDVYTEDCFERFKKMIKNRKGICITREITYVKDDENVFIIPLEKDLKPRNVKEIEKELSDNIEKDCVILLTNIEYLLKGNTVEEIRNFLENLNKKSMLNNCKLILSANLKNTKEKERNILKDLIADIHLGILSDSISNYIRRKIISFLSDGKKYSFTRIAQEMKIEDNPKLSFHLKKLKDDGVLEQDEEKRYYLSKMGKEIADFINNIKKDKLKKGGEILWMPLE
ncbi:MAG TPA: response regulator [Thermoplasmatales archaeon]|nr:response regulator [Thermoplasmatales archaeon]